MTESFDWLKPSPLWQGNGSDIREQDYAYFRPRVLEFESDNFIEDFLTAAKAPEATALDSHIPEAPEDGSPRKVYLPYHGCFYLVSASLCCRVPSTPDRQVDADTQESVFFVLRKLIGGSEYAWVPEGPNKGWQPLTSGPRTILQGEQRMPLNQAPTACDRSVWFGYLPVASSETYDASPDRLLAMADPGDSFEDTREFELKARFSRMLDSLPASLPPNSPPHINVTMSVFMLLDLWEFFEKAEVLPDVALALRDHPEATFPGEPAKAQLMAFLRTQQVSAGLSLAKALSDVARKRVDLEKPEADPWSLGFHNSYNIQGKHIDVDRLEARVNAALPAATRPALEMPKLEMKSDAAYVVRCAYERPQCSDIPEVVSLASEPFVIARFFDPDAPARAVKIPMPADVSVAGLRKFKRGVSFMLSKSMNEKVLQITGKEKGLMKDPPELNGDPSADFAFICSFSIQIIFIVAFFLLLVFVVVLNFVFWWIAFFKICLPIPKGLVKES